MKRKLYYQLNILLLLFSSLAQAELKLSGLNIDNRTEEALLDLGYTSNSPIRNVLEEQSDGHLLIRIYSELFSKVGDQNADISEARAYTELLTLGIEGNSAKDFVTERLSMPPFEESYFNEQAKENLLRKSSDYISADFIKVLGVAEVDHPGYDLEEISQRERFAEDERVNLFLQNLGDKKGNFFRSHIWAAMLVQARRGDQAALKRIEEYMAGIESEDLYRKYSEAVIELGYVRQPETIDLLVKYLRNERGGPLDPIPLTGSDQIFHGLAPLAVRGLSLSLADFPFSIDDYWKESYFWEDVEVAREFINNYEGDWRIIGKWEPEEQQPASAVEIPEEFTEPEPAIEEKPAEAVVTEPIKEDTEQSSNWWLWLIGAVVVVGGVFVLRSRK